MRTLWKKYGRPGWCLVGAILVGAIAVQTNLIGAPQQNPTNKPSAKSNKAQPITITVSCDEFHANYQLSDGVFSNDGFFYYVLGGEKAVAGVQPSQRHKILYKIDLKSNTIEKVIEADILGNGALVFNKGEVAGLSYLLFKEKDNVCHAGESSGFSLVFGEQMRLVKSHTAGQYQIVASNDGRSIADLKDGHIKEVDMLSRQHRRGMALSHDGFTIYLDQPQSSLLVWSNKKPRTLLKYKLPNNDPIETLPLSKDEKLLQQGGLIATVKANKEKNQLQIRHLEPWTLTKGSYTVSLDKSYPVSQGLLRANFAEKTLLIYPKLEKYKSVWKDLMIWDYGSDKLLQSKRLADDEYVAVAEFNPAGDSVLIVLKRIGSGQIKRVLIHQIKTKNWLSLKIPE